MADFPEHFYQLTLDDKRGFSMEYEVFVSSSSVSSLCCVVAQN